MQEAFVGIDVAFAKRKRLPIVICSWVEGRLVPVRLQDLQSEFEPPRGSGNAACLDDEVIESFCQNACVYVREVCKHLDLRPVRIAIDAPRAPRDESSTRRDAERAMDAAGISCFTTPSASEFHTIREKVRRHLTGGGPENRIPHANQLWMLVGFRLFSELESVAPCIEVFPQATVREIGAGDVHKFRQGGTEAQLHNAAVFTKWPASAAEATSDFATIAFAPDHDRLDAYLSAWVAALHEDERKAYGTPPLDVIWVPKVHRRSVTPNWELPVTVAPSQKAKQRTTPSTRRASTSDGAFTRKCPACENHVFKRWPFGWDAHAAHRCSGLEGSDAEERKREFKRRFGHLFRSAGDA